MVVIPYIMYALKPPYSDRTLAHPHIHTRTPARARALVVVISLLVLKLLYFFTFSGTLRFRTTILFLVTRFSSGLF